MPARSKVLKNVTEEYNRILDIAQKYAIHYPKVAFNVKKVRADFHSEAFEDEFTV